MASFHPERISQRFTGKRVASPRIIAAIVLRIGLMEKHWNLIRISQTAAKSMMYSAASLREYGEGEHKSKRCIKGVRRETYTQDLH
jgi:hypothetical protein